MKLILKKAVIPIFLSIIFGGICGRVVYKIYLGNTDLAFDNNLIYLIQNGSYSTYDNMRANSIGYDYVYYEENDSYNTIIGVTKNKDNIEKIKKIYNNDVIIKQYYVNDFELNNELLKYDNMIKYENDDKKIKNIVAEMLGLYKKRNDIKLIKVSWFKKNNWQICIFHIKLYM